MEDDLLRIFGGDRVKKMMEMLKIPEGEPIESRIVTKAIENAQKRVEAQNFQTRKRLLEYDNVMSDQRQVVYSLRRDILEGENLKEDILEFIRDIIEKQVYTMLPEEEPELWETEPLKNFLKELTGQDIEIPKVRDKAELVEKLYEKVKEIYEEKEKSLSNPELMREVERITLLNILDFFWREHLHDLDRLREGIYLRGYAQKDPLVEYKKEAFQMFEDMMDNIKLSTISTLLKTDIKSFEEVKQEYEQEIEEHNKLMEQAVFSGVEGKSDHPASKKGPRKKTLKERLKAKKKR